MEQYTENSVTDTLLYAPEISFEKDLPLKDLYAEVIDRRHVSLESVKKLLSSAYEFFEPKGLCGISFKNASFKYYQQSQGKIIVVISEKNEETNEIISQKFVFTPYSVQVEGVPPYMYEIAKLNKIYLEKKYNRNEIYLKDYIDYIIASYPMKSEVGLMISVTQKLAYLRRFPINIQEFASSGYNTENIGSKLGYLNIDNPSDLKAYLTDLSDAVKKMQETEQLSYNQFVKRLSDRISAVTSKYEIDKLANSQGEEPNNE